jgi:hypothetical protein
MNWRCGLSALVVSSTPLLISAANAQSTGALIEISNKKYVPIRGSVPTPTGHVDKGGIPPQLTVRDGDRVTIKNSDDTRWKPFSISKHNQFSSAKVLKRGLIQGGSYTFTLHNPTDKPIFVHIYDDIHSKAKIGILVLPAAAKNFTGEWNTNWGPMTLTQTGNSVSGKYSHSDGSLQGNVSGNVLRFHWAQKGNGTKGGGKFELSSDGSSFKGTWNYDKKPDDGGSSWTGTRKK